MGYKVSTLFWQIFSPCRYQERWRELPPEFRSLHLGGAEIEIGRGFLQGPCRIYIYHQLHGEFGVHTQQIWRLFYLHRCHVHWSHVLFILEVIFGEIWLAGSRMFASHLLPIPGKQVGTLWNNKHQGRSQTIPHPFLNAIPVISPFWFFEFGVRRRKTKSEN